jgi:hypothetical protein
MNTADDRNDAETSGNQPSATGTVTPASPTAKKSRPSGRRRLRLVFFGLLVIYLGTAIYQAHLKPLPTGLSLAGSPCPVAGADVEFLYDVTGFKDSKRLSQQMIFDRTLGLIRDAQDFVLVDFFLFNENLGQERSAHRKLCQEVTSALLEKKRALPGIHIVVISDPVNEAYGGPVPEHFVNLRAAGIPVFLTDLRRLRDSNPIYSSCWRMFVQWFGSARQGSLPHPLGSDGGRISVRSWLALLNFKANHRKLVLADAPAPADGRQMVSLVMSANPHDASSAHGNVGLLVRGGVWRDLLRGEQAILRFSGTGIDLSSWLPSYAPLEGVPGRTPAPAPFGSVRVLTEGKVREALLHSLCSTRSGDTIDLAMFYLSERSVVNALVSAAHRGVAIRLTLDPNRDAFGYQKNGVPNRPVAAELIERGAGKITVRWCETHGEQFHTKMVLVKQGDHVTLFAGSANLTRRNIGDLNLETDLELSGGPDLPAIQDAARYFQRLWTNEGLECTVPYDSYGDKSLSKYWQYRFQEATGLCTF